MPGQDIQRVKDRRPSARRSTRYCPGFLFFSGSTGGFNVRKFYKSWDYENVLDTLFISSAFTWQGWWGHPTSQGLHSALRYCQFILWSLKACRFHFVIIWSFILLASPCMAGQDIQLVKDRLQWRRSSRPKVGGPFPESCIQMLG